MKEALINLGVGTGTCIYDMPFFTIEFDSVLVQKELAKLHIETFSNVLNLFQLLRSKRLWLIIRGDPRKKQK